MSDLIERQAAIDAVSKACFELRGVFGRCEDALKALPSVQPDRKKGRWIKDGVAYSLYKCTACNDLCTVAGWAGCIPEEQMYKAFKYCPNCGADMRGEKDE